MKRSADEADVGAVISEFKQVDEMLGKVRRTPMPSAGYPATDSLSFQLIKDLKAYRNSWEDILKLQYDTSEAFANLYKPIEPSNAPEMRHQPAVTPSSYMQKCLGMQKLYSETRDDLLQELTLIDQKLVRPVEQAKEATKGLQKTLKHRENTKLDFERYQSRVQHAQKKEQRSMKEEAALAAHEQNLAQAQIDYQTADEQVKQTFPPVTAAVLSLFPYLQASLVMMQTTLVGQLYTVLDKYTKVHKMPNPAPSDAEIIRAWEAEFSGFRKELEQGISTIANGKAVNRPMTLPPEHGSTVTGLGIRNKAGGLGGKVGEMMGRKPSGSLGQQNDGQSDTGARSSIGARISSFGGGRQQNQQGQQPLQIENGSARHDEDDDSAPPKPPRAGASNGAVSPYGMPSPAINYASKPRIPSTASSGVSTPYPSNPPPSYDHAAGSASPASQYATPRTGSSPAPNHANDYFAGAAARRTSQSCVASAAASLAAGKKKPPPPIPVKRFPSTQTQYVTALYDFEGQNEGDLAFSEGDRIKVVRKTGSVDDWWEGELNGRTGSFPANYVEL